jgi:hypothetical protein
MGLFLFLRFYCLLFASLAGAIAVIATHNAHRHNAHWNVKQPSAGHRVVGCIADRIVP